MNCCVHEATVGSRVMVAPPKSMQLLNQRNLLLYAQLPVAGR
uniref:Uncharacterized protein n=1 Tax=Pseudomonas fluorescens (strain SBW25) TaxID=216595 RepID=A0A0G4E4I3_PSEFS|nr:hypothetical protein PQBR57_0192 [Pseudomonas fluorescens SBW25]